MVQVSYGTCSYSVTYGARNKSWQTKFWLHIINYWLFKKRYFSLVSKINTRNYYLLLKKKSTSLNIYKEFLKSSTPFFLSMMQFDNYINNINLNIFCHKFCFEDIRDTNIFICCNNDAICKITILVKTMLNVLL